MNTEKTRVVAVVAHLTIHKVGFHVKFPATLSLQLDLDRKTTSILEGIQLGKQTIQINKQSRFETALNYDEPTKSYENKKATILICIKTKTSENKLTAGVVPISLTGPSQHVTNTLAKPVRCNDPKAFIEYSLRTETLRSVKISPQQSTSCHPADMLQTKKAIFKSAVYYNNTFADQEDPELERQTSKNELDKYISGPLAKDQRKRYKSSGKLPQRSIENYEEDDSRTEVLNYRKEKFQNDASIVSSSRHSIEKQARQLSKRSEALSKEVSEARIIQQNLKAQNKQLKAKIAKFERELDEQSSQIAHLNKRSEMKETSSAQQVRQLRTKLAEVETHLHQLLLEKNQHLNQMEAKEKEAAALIKEKQKAVTQGKRKHMLELQLKRQQIESIINEKNQLADSLNHSQKMLIDLIVQMQAKQKECQILQKSLQGLQLEMFEKSNALHGLQTQIVGKQKAVQDLKAQKKLIYEIKHERDQKDIALAQITTAMKQLQIASAHKDEQLKKKLSQVDNLDKENQSLKSQLKQQAAKQAELQTKLKQYELELKRSADNSSKIGKQIMQVESELKGFKKQANTQATEKTKLMEDYQSMIAALQEKIAIIQEERGVSQREIARLNHLCKLKEEQCYDLGQQLIISKDEAAHLTNQMQLIRQQNNYLAKTVKELTEKEQRLLRAEQRLQYNERLFEQFEQKHELQRIQLQGQIKSLQDRNQQKSQALRSLSDQLRKSEKEQLQMQDQIQTLKIGLANRTSELNFLKMQVDRNRDNTIQFQQRMAVLRRTEQNASSTADQLREETENLRRELKENTQAMNKLGKRYDSLCKNTFQALTQFFDLIRSQKSIMNSNVRHEKVQISTLFNDCIRHVALQRQNTAVTIENLRKALEQETAANKENMKIIRLKAQMQNELQQETRAMKAHVQSLQSIIVKLQRDIHNHLQTIKQRQTTLADLNSNIVSLHRDHSNQLAKKDETIQKGAQQIDRLNYQIQLDAQRYNANVQKIKLAMANLEAELQGKISTLNQSLTEVNGELKQEREISKQQKLKINEIQSVNTKLNKQKQDISNDLEKRTNQLIAARLETENRNKIIMEKESQILKLQKQIDRLTNDKNNLSSKISKCEQINKEMSIKKTECQATLKERNNEILLLKIKIDEIQQAKNKMLQQRQDLIKNKGIQQTLVSNLNQSIRSLKDAAIASEDKIKKLNFEKQCTDKENNKKLNIINSEKAVLERQLSDLKLKLSQKQIDFAAKQRALQDQIKLSKAKMNENSTLIADLRKKIQAGNHKMTNLLNEFNAKTAELQSKEKSLLPSAGKLKEVMQSISELRSIGKQYEASKIKLLRLTSSTRFEQQNYEKVCEVARQLGVAINKVKIQILNKLNISTEMKTTLLEALKSLQIIAEKLNKH